VEAMDTAFRAVAAHDARGFLRHYGYRSRSQVL
jgi:hypothetical protein